MKNLKNTATFVRTCVFASAFVPALVLLLYVALYSVNGPEWDHLNSAEIFARWDSGNLTFEYLFRPHNEHRKAVPRLVILGLGKLTGFDNRAEMLLHWALACGCAGLLLAAFWRDHTPARGRWNVLVSFAPISALALSARPYESLLGDGMPTFLSLIFLLAALCLIAFRGGSALGLAASIAFGLLASFSQSNGLLIWPIGFLILLSGARARPRTPAVIPGAILWAAVGVATIAAYFHGYHDPGNHPTASSVLAHPPVAVGYLLGVLGSPLAPWRTGAAIVGAVLLLTAALFSPLLAREWWVERRRPPFGFWLVLLGMLTSAMITLNRADAGADPLIATRYTPFSGLAAMGLYWIAVARRDSWRFGPWLAAGLGALLIGGYLAGSLDAWAAAPGYYSRKSLQAYLVYTAKYQASPILQGLYPNPDHARIYSADLERLGLNVFADDHIRPETLAASPDVPPYSVEFVNGQPAGAMKQIVLGDQDPIVIAGWALDAERKGAAPAMFLTIDGTVDIPGHMGIYRPDLGGRIRQRARRWGGFLAAFGGFVLAPGEHTVAVKIVSADRRHAFVTPIVTRVIRR